MPLARIVTRTPAEAGPIVERLRSQGYTVEIIDPGTLRVSPAQLEVRVERMPRAQASRRAVAAARERNVVLAAGALSADELRRTATHDAKKRLSGRISSWLAARRERRRDTEAQRASERERAQATARERAIAEAEQQRTLREARMAAGEQRRAEEREQRQKAQQEAERQAALAAETLRLRQAEEEQQYRERQAALEEQRRREEEARIEAERQRSVARREEEQRREEERRQQLQLAREREQEWRDAEAREAERQRSLAAAFEKERVAAETGQMALTEVSPSAAPTAPEPEERPRALFPQKTAAASAAARAHMEALRRRIPRLPRAVPPRRSSGWLKAGILAAAISVAMMLGWAAATNRQPASPLPVSTLQSSQGISEQLPFTNATVTPPQPAPRPLPAAAPATTAPTPVPEAPAASRVAGRTSKSAYGAKQNVVVRHYDSQRADPNPTRVRNRTAREKVKHFSDISD